MQILLVRLRLIGDVVFTTPAIRALRRHYPDARLTYLVEAQAAPVVRGNPHLDEVMVVRRSRGWTRIADDWRLGRTLARRRFDLVIDFHGGPRGSWLTWLTGARQRLGYTVAGRSWMYTQAVERPRELRPRHSVENQWDLLAALGMPPPTPVDDPLEMTEDPAARASVDARLAAGRTRAGHAADRDARQRRQSVSALAGRFVCRGGRRPGGIRCRACRRPDVGAVRIGGRRSGRACGSASWRGRRPSGSCGIGEFDLAELRALIGRAALYIGGDSGPLHIAGTTTTPVVGLFGPTLAVRSLPWRDPAVPALGVEPGAAVLPPVRSTHVRARRFPVPDGQTPPERVIEAAERALAHGPRRDSR